MELKLCVMKNCFTEMLPMSLEKKLQLFNNNKSKTEQYNHRGRSPIGHLRVTLTIQSFS